MDNPRSPKSNQACCRKKGVSGHRHEPCQSLSLVSIKMKNTSWQRKMAGAAGFSGSMQDESSFEPATSNSEGWCLVQARLRARCRPMTTRLLKDFYSSTSEERETPTLFLEFLSPDFQEMLQRSIIGLLRFGWKKAPRKLAALPMVLKTIAAIALS